jgi:hypothetical protein
MTWADIAVYLGLWMALVIVVILLFRNVNN